MPIDFRKPNYFKEFKFGATLVWAGINGVLKTITGVSPLSLTNALAKNIVSLTQYGLCTQASTPTPSSPVDIKCNNGVIKVKHQSGLPVECALLESIESTGTQYIETGIHLDYGKDIGINGTVVNKTANKRKIIVGNYNVANAMSMSLEFAGLGQSGLTSDGMRVFFGTNSQALPTLYSKSTAALPLNTDIDFDFVYTAETRSFTLTCIANGQTYTLSDTIPNMFDGVSGETMTLFLDKRTDTSAIRNSLTIKAMSITNDATAKEYVPVKKGNNVGMYDTVGGAFYANAGTSAFVGGSSVADPLTIYTVGTSEVLTVSGANLLDPSVVIEDNDYINSRNGGTTSPSASGGVFRYSGFIPVKEGTEYFFGITPFSAASAGIAWYSTDDVPVTGFISGINGTTLRNSTNNMKATAPEGAQYLRFCWRIDEGYDTDWQHSVYLCECVNNEPVMSAWQPYVNLQTVNDIPMLLSVGDYADEAEIISGLLTHKVGIKVFDGTENWELHSDASGTYRLDDVFTDLAQNVPILSSLLCTHFSATNTLDTASFTSGMARWAATSDGSVAVYTRGTRLYVCFGLSTVQEVKAFLAAQCVAGAPVIVVYPLADETTETITGQALHTAKGNNTVTVTAEVDDI